MRPALRPRLLVNVVWFGWDGHAQQLEIGWYEAEHLPGHAQGDKIQKRGLAAARPAHQHQILVFVQRFQGRWPTGVAVDHGARGAARRVHLLFASVPSVGQQRGVDGRQLHRCAAFAGKQWQLVRSCAQPREVCASQIIRTGAGLGSVLDDGLVDIAAAGADRCSVVALDYHRALAGGLGFPALRDAAALD
ncbi:MAG: hypothetical protein ACREPE_13805, partial [Lysobacter sp.]